MQQADVSSARGSRSMIVLLNGPLGIGKSSLGEALSESLEDSVHLDADALIATNPPIVEGSEGNEHLHGALTLLVAHHLRFGLRHFVINHIWLEVADLEDLRDRLEAVVPDAVFRVFRLCLGASENLARIERRARSRALDELEFELRTMREERAHLRGRDDLGEPFEVDRPLDQLVESMRSRLTP